MDSWARLKTPADTRTATFLGIVHVRFFSSSALTKATRRQRMDTKMELPVHMPSTYLVLENLSC